MGAILRIDSLCKDFSGLEVLYGISMDLIEGERHAIIGPNGSGKTTLFNIITGRYKPSKGGIYFFDRNISGWPPHKIARLGLSRSFQVTNVFPKMTIYENVRSGVVSKFNRRVNWVRLLNRDRRIQQESERIIDLLSLNEARNVPASELSYGMQRHLEMALTMVQEPILVMMDEPTAGLNSDETRAAIRLIRHLTEGRTLLMVEHDMEVVFNLADRITVLSYGRVLITGTVDEIRNNEEVKKVYLGRR